MSKNQNQNQLQVLVPVYEFYAFDDKKNKMSFGQFKYDVINDNFVAFVKQSKGKQTITKSLEYKSVDIQNAKDVKTLDLPVSLLSSIKIDGEGPIKQEVKVARFGASPSSFNVRIGKIHMLFREPTPVQEPIAAIGAATVSILVGGTVVLGLAGIGAYVLVTAMENGYDASATASVSSSGEVNMKADVSNNGDNAGEDDEVGEDNTGGGDDSK